MTTQQFFTENKATVLNVINSELQFCNFDMKTVATDFLNYVIEEYGSEINYTVDDVQKMFSSRFTVFCLDTELKSTLTTNYNNVESFNQKREDAKWSSKSF